MTRSRFAVFVRIVCVLMLAVPVLAEALPRGRTLARAMARQRVRPNVSIEDTVTFRLVLPIVGNAPGANNTFFKSSVTLLNNRFDEDGGVVPQRIAVQFYPRNGSSDGQLETFVLEGIAEQWDNFMADFFSTPKQGLGSLVITSIDAAGNVDEEGLIDAVTRIYTAQAATGNCLNPNGEVSQAMTSVTFEDLDAAGGAVMTGLIQNARFRTNIGIVNHSESEQVFDVIVYPFNGEDPFDYPLTVPARGMIHEALPAGDYGGGLLIEIFPRNEGFFFSTYGSTVDNNTGDGWTFRGTW
jgi:hypothetical protein